MRERASGLQSYQHSPSAFVNLELKQLKGEMWGLSRLVMAVVNKTSWYADMGIETSWAPVDICCDDPRVVSSNDFATLLVDLACATIAGESTRLLPYIFGYVRLGANLNDYSET